MDARAINRQIKSQLDSISAVDAAWCRQRLAAVQQRLKKRQPVEKLLKSLLVLFGLAEEEVIEHHGAEL